MLPSSLTIETVTPQNRLFGIERQDLTVSCKAVGGKPAPNVVVIVDGQTKASQPKSVQYTLNTINICYDRKTVTCQASNPVYPQDVMTVSAVIYIDCE